MGAVFAGGRPRRLLLGRAIVLVGVVAVAAVGLLEYVRPRATHASTVLHDSTLRALPLYFYRPRASAHAMLFFFGNDVGFWKAHEELAERLAADDIAVVGFDVTRWLSTLPSDDVAREAAFRTGVADMIVRTRHEMGADTLPLVLGGHSIGAELALWTAAHAPPAGLVGVLVMSPGERSHLRVTLSDRAEQEPTEPASFAIADVVCEVPSGVRIALVRGMNDPLRRSDDALTSAGGPRLHRYLVPLAAHSLRQLTLAGPVISEAMGYLLAR
jgi:pimeloyl-ACP methyl ester carboxylesterase